MFLLMLKSGERERLRTRIISGPKWTGGDPVDG
jgi:hypothetical protein